MKTGDILKVEIIDDNHLGNGIAKMNDISIFVPQTVKGDIVEVQIEKIHQSIAFAKMIKVLKKSNKHIKVTCPYYDKCGGCDLLHISYDREKILKENYIKKLFKGFDFKIISFDREHYRNKVTLHVSNNDIGFYEKDSNKLVSVQNCLLLDKSINEIITIISKLDLSEVSEVIIKKGKEGLLISVDGYLNDNDLEKLKLENVKSIYQNDQLIYGKEYLTISFDDIDYNFNNNSFFQINNECAKSLYDKVKYLVGKCDSLLDLYCGTGSIGIYLKDNAKSIVGIEINKDSVKCAEKNIADNNIKNYKIINADASCIDKDYDVVIVDPPRSGLSKDVINILNEMKTKKLIYISCNPSTLKRDISLLNSFCLKEISVFNMFPGTKHIETLSVLEKK